MRTYLSNIIKLAEYTVKNEGHLRFYGRWVHRKPVRVFTPDEFESQQNLQKSPRNDEQNFVELDPSEIQQPVKKYIKPKQGQKNKFSNRNVGAHFDMDTIDAKTHLSGKERKTAKQNVEVKTNEPVKHTTNEVLNVTFDDEGNYAYNKMKDNDSRIGSLMLMVKSRKLRNNKHSVLLEGKRLIKDALESGCTLEHLLFSRKSDLEFIRDLVPQDGVKLYKMAYRDMQMWSDLTTCPGIMGIFKTPNVEKNTISSTSLPLTIICDNIREPGNLGAILRATAAVGCKNIILTKGCVDLWEPKVLRSASGAHFRLPIQKNIEWPQIHNYVTENTSIFLADNKVLTTNNEKNSESLEKLCTNVPILPYYGVDFKDYESIAVVVGGETLGLSEEAYKLAMDCRGARLNIPLDNRVESLNTGTALGIIAFEIKRQLTKK